MVRVLHCSVARDGTPLLFSDAWRHFTALDPAQLDERGWSALVHPDDVDALLAAWRDGGERESPFTIEVRCRDSGGAFPRCTLTATPLFGTAATMFQWIATLDVHESADDAVERDASLVVRRQGLMSTLAHELRDPLQAMRQATFVLQLPNLGETARTQMLDVLARQLTRLSGVSDAVLDLTSLSWNAVRVTRHTVPLRQVVALASAQVDELLRERAQLLEVSMSDPDCEVTVDAQRLARALGHLLDNAARYSEPGSRVALAAQCHDREVEFTVEDEGVGIAAESLPRIFDMFRRDMPTNERTTRRLGVGLALARHVTHLHGGTLLAESDGPGRGSRFRLRIPRR